MIPLDSRSSLRPSDPVAPSVAHVGFGAIRTAAHAHHEHTPAMHASATRSFVRIARFPARGTPFARRIPTIGTTGRTRNFFRDSISPAAYAPLDFPGKRT